MPLNDINQDQQLGYYSSEYFTLDYKNGSGTYVPVPGVMDISFSGSTAPPRDIISANTAPQQKLGMSRVGQVTVNATYLPQDPAWRAIRDAQYDQSLMHFRVRWNGIEYFTSTGTGAASSKFTITGAGVIAFAAGTGAGAQAAPTIAGTPLGQGQLIVAPKSGTKKAYLITDIDDNGVITGVEVNTTTNAYNSSPTAVSNGIDYTIYSPAPLQRSFSALISQGADMEMGAESEMTTSLVLAPTVRLPDPAIYIPA